jgi:hypothetical protein
LSGDGGNEGGEGEEGEEEGDQGERAGGGGGEGHGGWCVRVCGRLLSVGEEFRSRFESRVTREGEREEKERKEGKLKRSTEIAAHRISTDDEGMSTAALTDEEVRSDEQEREVRVTTQTGERKRRRGKP